MEFSDIPMKNKAPVSNYLPTKHYTPSFTRFWIQKIAVNK